jgi:hypothetical protein
MKQMQYKRRNDVEISTQHGAFKLRLMVPPLQPTQLHVCLVQVPPLIHFHERNDAAVLMFDFAFQLNLYCTAVLVQLLHLVPVGKQ